MNNPDSPTAAIIEKTCSCKKFIARYVILAGSGNMTKAETEARMNAFKNGKILPLKPGETATVTCPECKQKFTVP